jgi:hypothetical protein
MRSLICIAAIAISSFSCSAQNNLAQTANRFINSLNTKQKAKTIFPFNGEERYNWHYFPKSRQGIPLNELDAQQKKAAFDLLKICVSDNAFQKATAIMQLETVLNNVEGGNGSYRDAGKYYFTIFGQPGEKTIWGWRLEGHHLSLNFSTKDNQLVAGTPGFMGSNPAIVQSGPQKGKQPLKEETEAGFTLLHSLSKAQLAKALISQDSPNDILTFVSRKAMIDHPQGIHYNELDQQQQEQLLSLTGIYIHRYTKLFAADMLKELKAAGLDKLQFAWAGAQQPGKNHYYRIQGPTIIIEYDNSQNNANHVHSVLRDLKHDFGGDELLEHYITQHGK